MTDRIPALLFFGTIAIICSMAISAGCVVDARLNLIKVERGASPW